MPNEFYAADAGGNAGTWEAEGLGLHLLCGGISIRRNGVFRVAFVILASKFQKMTSLDLFKLW